MSKEGEDTVTEGDFVLITAKAGKIGMFINLRDPRDGGDLGAKRHILLNLYFHTFTDGSGKSKAKSRNANVDGYILINFMGDIRNESVFYENRKIIADISSSLDELHKNHLSYKSSAVKLYFYKTRGRRLRVGIHHRLHFVVVRGIMNFSENPGSADINLFFLQVLN